MNKQLILNALVLVFSLSALGAPNAQRTNAQRKKNGKGTSAFVKTSDFAKASSDKSSDRSEDRHKSETHTHDARPNKQLNKPAIEESWSKLLRLKWTSMSRYDAWNIGASIIAACGLVYLCKPIATKPIPDGACDVCLEDKKGHEFCTLSCCGHNTSCTECLTEMIQASLQEKSTVNILCPNRDCARPISGRDIRTITRAHPEIYKTYNDVTQREWLAKHGTHCPTPNCTYAFVNKYGQKSFTCPQCRNTYCTKCLQKHPVNVSCDRAGKQADDQWKKEHTKKCPSCKADIEKNEGCNHMTCKCNYQFCWVCLKRWKTCACPQFPA